jgi:hypothetical protein
MAVQRPALTILLFAVTTSPSRADMPGVPGTSRTYDVIHQITADEPFRDYVFVLDKHKTTEFVEMTPDAPLVVDGGVHSATLFAVPRSAVKPNETPKQIAEDHAIPGKLAFTLSFREEIPVWHSKRLVITHRIRRSSSGAPELVKTSFNPMIQCCVAGVLVPVAIMLGGVWLIRRSQRHKGSAQS